MSDGRPIALFDSGVGGLSVWRAVRELLPQEALVYLGDTAHIPYGRRSHAEIESYAHEIVRFFVEELEAKLVVVACNTASAASLQSLRARYPVPIVGMEPAVKPAAERTRRRRVGVIATQATIQATVFARLVERFANGVEVWTQACPGLVEAVEEGRLEDAGTIALLREYLSPMLKAGIDELVLGCTHYPFLMPALRQVVGPDVDIIDPAPAVARQVGRVLDMHGLRTDSLSAGSTRFFCTGDVQRFRQTAERLVGPIGEVHPLIWESGRLKMAPAGSLTSAR